MSRQSVFEGLTNALRVRSFLFHHVEDEAQTIVFESWDQFRAFDHFLDSIATPDDIKLCIYAERVGGRGDGVAVTVSDDVQRLSYMTSRLDMPAKLAAFEGLLSSFYRRGTDLLDYDYETFTIDLNQSHHDEIGDIELPHYISHWQDSSGTELITIHLEFPT